VQADALAQLTGDLWQVSPSVFVGAKTRPRPGVANITAAEEKSPTLVDDEAFFRCPACEYAPLPDTPPDLVCPQCGRHYPVVDGIYDLRVNRPEQE
jgi:uncharacterized protein YbaR (Trm112 family)